MAVHDNDDRNPYASPESDVVSREIESARAVDRRNWPILVRLGLVGVPTRAAAWGWFWVSIAIAVGCVCYGFVNPVAFAGGALFLAALWYYSCIRWVDQNSSWTRK